MTNLKGKIKCFGCVLGLEKVHLVEMQSVSMRPHFSIPDDTKNMEPVLW